MLDPVRQEEQEQSDVVAERVSAVLEAAEEAAAAIRREAEEVLTARRAEADREAARILANARRQASELTGAVAAQARELLRRLEDAQRVKADIEALLDGLGEPAPRPGGRLDTVEEARLLALQMAMGGRTRGEVEADLRHGLRLADPDAILDDVFGKGTAADQRIPWSMVSKGETP